MQKIRSGDKAISVLARYSLILYSEELLLGVKEELVTIKMEYECDRQLVKIPLLLLLVPLFHALLCYASCPLAILLFT